MNPPKHITAWAGPVLLTAFVGLDLALDLLPSNDTPQGAFAWFLLTLACVALPVLTGKALRQLFTEPLERLTQAMQQAGKGQYEPLPEERSMMIPRIAQATREFNAMVAQVTERERDQQRACSEAQAASKAKTKFLADMSHEIRTPMNGILGAAGILADSDLSESQREMVEVTQGSAVALLTIINDILDFSKIEAGMLRLEKVSTCLPAMIEEVGGLFSVLAQDKGLGFAVECDPNLPQNALVDGGRLRQILANFIGNAIKFTEEGQVTLKVEYLRANDVTFTASFSICDTGIGVSEEAKQRIFSEYGQADSSTTRRFGGTGLGLSINKQLIELMGGELQVDSELDVGSVFSFDLEMEHSVPRRKMYAGCSVQHPLNARVLLVEDHPVNQLVARRQLLRFGCQVQVADHGRDAIALLEQKEFDVVLMDCQMPIMDGFEATLAIRASTSSYNQIPIIALTATVTEGAREACIQVGMNDYVAKPIDIEDLKVTLQRWTGEKSSTS